MLPRDRVWLAWWCHLPRQATALSPPSRWDLPGETSPGWQPPKQTFPVVWSMPRVTLSAGATKSRTQPPVIKEFAIANANVPVTGVAVRWTDSFRGHSFRGRLLGVGFLLYFLAA